MNPDGQINGENDGEPESLNMYTPTDDAETEVINGQEEQPNNSDVDGDDDTVHWSYAEYIKRDKNNLWYIIFVIVLLGLIALDVFVLKTYFTFSALVVVMAIAVIVLNSRPPMEIDYTLSPMYGLYIGEILHPYSEFKSFGVINDDGHNSIMLIPVKRFSFGVSIYFPTEVGEAIVDVFGAKLPMVPLKLNAVDVLVRKLHL